ncbi:MAG: hypothetical protein ACR2MD_01885, partial [Aridibacter sp.]
AANLWTEALFNIIPETRLQDCFNKAFEIHRSNFPVNATELKYAWELIKNEEAKIAAELEEAELNPVDKCVHKNSHFINENGEDNGEVEVMNPFDTTEDVIAPCAYCRPLAFDIFRQNQARKYGENPPKPLAIVSSVAQTNADTPKAKLEAQITAKWMELMDANLADTQLSGRLYDEWKLLKTHLKDLRND